MIKRLALVLMVFLLNLSSPALAAGTDAGIIQGQVLNGTPGGSSVAGETVTLESYLDDVLTANATSRTDSTGKFVFEGLSTAPGNSYDVKIRYQDADYVGRRVTLSDNQTTQSLTIEVYNSTSSDSAISITAAHTLIYPGQGNLQVVEYLVFTNSANLTYIGSGDLIPTGGRRTLRFPLPPDSTGLEYGGDLVPEKISPDTAGFADTEAVLPGDKLVAYGYQVDFDAVTGSYKFSENFDYPISSYNFLVQGENTTAVSAQLSAGQVVDFQGLKFVSLNGGNIPRGQTITVQISNLSPNASQGNRLTGILVGIGVLVVVGISLGFLYMMKKRNPLAVNPEDDPEIMKKQLLLEIANLDDDYESGNIEKAAYEKIRAEKKSVLVGLIQGSQEESDEE